ncbi:unnamed protein product, partial [Mesorhabditis spiculigera]
MESTPPQTGHPIDPSLLKTPTKPDEALINSRKFTGITPEIQSAAVAEEKKENMAISGEKIPLPKLETPEAVRMRREQQAELAKMHMSSPSDSMLSPCTSKLFGKEGRRKAAGPAALLRKKQQGAIPFNMADEE